MYSDMQSVFLPTLPGYFLGHRLKILNGPQFIQGVPSKYLYHRATARLPSLCNLTEVSVRYAVQTRIMYGR